MATTFTGLQREIDFAEDVVRNYPANSLLVAVDLNQTKISAPIAAFFNRNAESNSVHKIAVLGVSRLRRIWYAKVRHVTWPKPVRFFDDYEQAKDWLVGESY